MEDCCQKNEIVIVLDRLRSAHNTGNIFRLADAVGAKEIIACGYTPAPPHPKLKKTAMGSDEWVPCRQFETSMEAVKALREEGIKQIVAIETSEDPICVWDYDYDKSVAIVLGNEALGIQEETLAMCDAILSLPMMGTKVSINVGNCAAVALYAIVKSLDSKGVK